MKLTTRLDNIHHQHQKIRDQEASFFGFKKYLASISQAEYEQNVVNLVIEIDHKLKEGNKGLDGSNVKKRVQKLFFEVVPSLKSEDARASIQELVAKNKGLQNYLDSELRNCRKAKVKSPHLIHDPHHTLSRKIAKARFALKLGLGTEAAGTGLSGSEFVRGINGKRLGLFKVTMDKTNMTKWLNDCVLPYFWSNQPYYLKSGPKAGVEAEEAAYVVSSSAGFGRLVPPTMVMSFNDVVGSFQLMAKKEIGDNITEFENIIDEFEQRESYKSEEVNLFQNFAVYDYLINNLDRHHGNWIVEYTNVDGEVELKRIHAIDHDRAFSVENPGGSSRGSKNQYKWKSLKIAGEEITSETKRFIQQNLQVNQIEGVIEQVMQNVPGFLTDSMKKQIYQKAAVLWKIANEGGTFKELGGLGNDDAIQSYLAP